MKKQIGMIVAAAAVIGGVIFLIGSVKPASHVPQEFTEARVASATAAEKLAGLLGDSLKNLSAVATRDRERDYSGALKIVNDELSSDKQKQEIAATLATETEKMARAIATIEPQTARQSALEAVSAQVAAISHVIIYDEYLHQLFGVLDLKFRNKLPNPDGQVAGLLERINNEAKTINGLNDQFRLSLGKFDQLTGGK